MNVSYLQETDDNTHPQGLLETFIMPNPYEIENNLKRCQTECCSFALWYKEEGGSTELLIPLKSVEIEASIFGALAQVTATLIFVNSESERPEKVCFEYPLGEGVVVSEFKGWINGAEIRQEVQDKVQTGEADLFEQNENDKDYESLVILLGTLEP